MKFIRNFCAAIYAILFIPVALALSPSAQGVEAKPDALPGFYSTPSTLCTRYDKKKDDFVSCVKQFKDCLLVKEIVGGKIAVEIYSTQADQHVCAVRGDATIENGIPTYRFGTTPESQRIEFVVVKDGVQLRHVVPDGEDSANCGAHASFDGLKFKKVDSNVGKHVCFKD